jgi:DNA (cytosine-5)-methyltransferase 1
MRCGHLFNGVGGFALAASWMGWENIFHCDNNAFCNRVMNHHFPNSFQHEDIRTTDFRIWRGRIDLVTGGDPCQGNSYAGKRKGKEDERYLWPEMYRAIKEIQPKWILNENVAGSISNGILDQKISDLEAEGYAWWPPLVIPANAVGALHRRDRVWLAGYSERHQQPRQKPCDRQAGRMGREFEPVAWDTDWESKVAEFRGMDDGLPNNLDRTDGVRNAICPQIAYELFKAIEQYETSILKQVV